MDGADVCHLRVMKSFAALPLLLLTAACAQLGLARNIPAEPWAAVEGTDSAIIEGLLRKHGLLPTLARA